MWVVPWVVKTDKKRQTCEVTHTLQGRFGGSVQGGGGGSRRRWRGEGEGGREHQQTTNGGREKTGRE